MGRKPRELKIVLKKHYVPLPPEMVAVRRAGLLLLWQLIKAEIEKENADEYLGFGVLGNGNRNCAPLFPVASVATWSQTAKARGLHAWVIGHHGSVQRVALVEWQG